MKYVALVNNYIYGKVLKQLKNYILEDEKIDSKHHKIIFNVENETQKQWIEKIIIYKLSKL